MNRQQPLAYSRAQIVLHWTIAALVLWQLFIGDDPPSPRRAAGAADLLARTAESSHVQIGLAILVLAVVRIILRLTHRAPPPVGENRVQALAAQATHLAFYALLLAMPATGIIAYYAGLPTGDLHEAGARLFVILIVLHAGAALWHQFVRRDGLMRRMLMPRRV